VTDDPRKDERGLCKWGCCCGPLAHDLIDTLERERDEARLAAQGSEHNEGLVMADLESMTKQRDEAVAREALLARAAEKAHRYFVLMRHRDKPLHTGCALCLDGEAALGEMDPAQCMPLSDAARELLEKARKWDEHPERCYSEQTMAAVVAERDRLRERVNKLRDYAHHKFGCVQNSTIPNDRPCTCGLVALAAADAAGGSDG
jgi:hypothetical protein